MHSLRVDVNILVTAALDGRTSDKQLDEIRQLFTADTMNKARFRDSLALIEKVHTSGAG